MLARSAYRTAAALRKVRRSSPPGSLPTTTSESADSYALLLDRPSLEPGSLIPHSTSVYSAGVRALVGQFRQEKKMTAPRIEDLADNALLAKLRDDDRRRLAPHMTVLDFQAKHTLKRAGDEVVDTWFPIREPRFANIAPVALSTAWRSPAPVADICGAAGGLGSRQALTRGCHRRSPYRFWVVRRARRHQSESWMSRRIFRSDLRSRLGRQAAACHQGRGPPSGYAGRHDAGQQAHRAVAFIFELACEGSMHTGLRLQIRNARSSQLILRW